MSRGDGKLLQSLPQGRTPAYLVYDSAGEVEQVSRLQDHIKDGFSDVRVSEVICTEL